MVKNILDNGIKINSFDKKCVLGLMTGITGIGYGLLGEIESSIPNILVLIDKMRGGYICLGKLCFLFISCLKGGYKQKIIKNL